VKSILGMLAGWQGYAIAAGAALLIGFAGGWQLRDLIADRAELKQVKREIVYRDRTQVVTREVAAKTQAAEERVRTVTRTIVREVPRYVTREADAHCIVPRGFVRLHDAAAQSVVPVPAGEPDDAPSGVELSAVAGTVADNYGACHETAERLTGLQAWVRAQEALAKSHPAG
jgi:hypothetical protein